MKGIAGCGVCKIITVLLALGALNWGLVALFQLNLVDRLLGQVPVAATALYILIGLAGLITLVSFVKQCPCEASKGK